MATTASGLPARRRSWRALAPFLVGSVLAGALVAIPAGPAAVADPSPSIEQIQAQIDQLQQDAADAAEAWNEAQLRLAGINRKIAVLTAKVKAAEKALGTATRSIDVMARTAYASGGMDGVMQAMLADNPTAFLDQAASLDMVARAQNAELRHTQSARLALAQAQAELAAQQAAAKAAVADAARARALISSKLGQAQSILAGLQAAQRAALLKAQAARRAAAAKAAAAARAAAAREAAAAARSTHASRSSRAAVRVSAGDASGRARIALAYALAQVGDRYVAGAAGPSSFDCSGLTMAAYRHAGISLPHYSYAQYQVTQHISRSELRPGDLLFYFGGSAHHVAMYIGGGMMVSASNPSAGVEVIGAWSPWYGEHYSGAGRVV